jgi:hypothetical protein
LIILAGFWLLNYTLVRANAYTTLSDILVLLLPVLLGFGLTWMRWWFVHSVPVGLETPN